MRSIRADEPRFSGRRVGAQISADVASGELERPQAGDLKVRKILANTPPLLEHLIGGRAYIRHF